MPTGDVQDRFTFNAYDLFANFLPGALLLIGVGFPFIVFNGSVPDLSLIDVVVLSTIAFGAGVVTQSIGSSLADREVFSFSPLKERNHPFNEKMEELLDEDASQEDFSGMEWKARKACIDAFHLSGDGSDDITLIFKSLLAYLESSKWNRGLRLQSLHLASRGLYIVSLFLAAYFFSFTLSVLIPQDIGLFVYSGSLAGIHFAFLGSLMFLVAYIMFKRARHFEDDVSTYILAEFYMDHYQWDSIELDEEHD